MATPGVPWTATDADIANALKACDGILRNAAKMLNVHHTTIRERVKKSPELTELLANLRYHFDENLLDLCESRLMQLIEQEQDKSVAMKGLMFSLNNKGKLRGYQRQSEQEDNTKVVGTLAQVDKINILPPNPEPPAN